MAKKYNFERVYAQTQKNFNMKKVNMNKMLKKMGIKQKVTKINLIHMMSTKPIYLDNEELKKLAHKKLRRI